MKVLVADDSAFMRNALAGMLKTGRGFEVKTARNGAEVLELIGQFHPDVVTLDINMPVMDGLTCLSRIMTECPCPVIMISSLTTAGATATLEALSMGAVDYIAKPGGTVSLNMDEIREQVVQKIEAIARARPRRGPANQTTASLARSPLGRSSEKPAPHGSKDARPKPQPARRGMAHGMILLGCSTGGPQSLEEVLPQLPPDFPWPVVIAQHMPKDFTRSLAERLDRMCSLSVIEVDRLTQAEAGGIYLARGDGDILVSRRMSGTFLMPAPVDPRYLWHPSVERMVRSALEHFSAAQLVAVQLTGMGHDGAEAMTELRRRGGHTVAESEKTAVVFGMPGALVEKGGAEVVLPLPEIAAQIRRWV
jgi:two-component system chemotaxis response regulator CheB